MSAERTGANSEDIAGWKFPKSMSELSDYVYFNDTNLLMCALFVVLTPLVWNIICRTEHRTRFFSKAFGSPHLACRTLSLIQIFCAFTRHYYFGQLLQIHPHFETPFNSILTAASYVLMAFGTVLVVGTLLRLGWTGTWHGDHFGILLPAKVTAFPFDILEHPMHIGSVLNYLGASLASRSLAGVIIACWLKLIYSITEKIEGPFTDMVYAQAAAAKKNAAKSE